MKFRPAGRFTARAAQRYQRDQGLIEKLLALSAVLLILIAAMAALIGSGAADVLAVAAFGFAIGLGTAITISLAAGVRELRRREKDRKKDLT